MFTHVGKAQLHRHGKTCRRHDLLDQTHLCARLNPLAEIVVATLVAVNLAVVVAQFPEPREVVVPALAAVTGGKGEGADRLDECRAVEVEQVDGQMFLLVLDFERLSHIRAIHQLVGKEDGDRLTVCPFAIYHFLCPKFQQLHHSDAVLARVAYRLSMQEHERMREQKTEKPETMPSARHLPPEHIYSFHSLHL